MIWNDGLDFGEKQKLEKIESKSFFFFEKMEKIKKKNCFEIKSFEKKSLKKTLKTQKKSFKRNENEN